MSKKITIGNLRTLIREVAHSLNESEVYFYRGNDGNMMYRDDEGNEGVADEDAAEVEGETLSYSQASRYLGRGHGEGPGSRSYTRGYRDIDRSSYRPNYPHGYSGGRGRRGY